MQVPFSPPDITEEEIQEVIEVLKSGWITTGPKTKLFEKVIKEYCRADGAVCLNSATACAEMALRLLEIGPGDEVITTAYTYTATASVVCHVSAKLVMVDVREGSFEMNYDELERAITKNTKAVIPVDLAGIPADYNTILDILKRKKHLFSPKGDIQKKLGRIAVIADGAHAFGAEYHGRMIGSVADFTSFSFHAVKNLTTAEGGALTWKHIEGISDEEIYKKLMLFSLHGQSKDALTKTKLGSWEYDVVAPYYKCNMTDIMAGIGLAQFRRYPDILKRRQDIIKMYDESLKDCEVSVLNHFGQHYISSGHLYLVRIHGMGRSQVNSVIEKMAEAGIGTNVHYKPLPMLSAYKNLGFDIRNYPEAYKFFENEITLPLHTNLTNDQIEYTIKMFKKCLE